MAQSILVVGAGSMGQALAKGLSLSSTISTSVHDIHASRLADVGRFEGINTIAELPKSLEFEAVVLCVKPQDFPALAKDLKLRLKEDITLISILAGLTLDQLQETTGHAGPIVRCMPNIAAQVQAAATVLCSNDKCRQNHRDLAAAIFATVGSVSWGKESYLDAVTGLSGSGPAYVYMVIEALSDGGVKMGLPRQLASELAVQTVLGAAKHVKESGEHPAILKEQVTTPAGTTIHAIHELESHGLRSMLISAVATATNKSATAGKGERA